MWNYVLSLIKGLIIYLIIISQPPTANRPVRRSTQAKYCNSIVTCTSQTALKSRTFRLQYSTYACYVYPNIV